MSKIVAAAASAAKHIGIGGVVLGLIALYFTKDPTLLLQSLTEGDNTQQSSGPYQESPQKRIAWA